MEWPKLKDVIQGLKCRIDMYDQKVISREHFEKHLAQYILDLIALAVLKEMRRQKDES